MEKKTLTKEMIDSGKSFEELGFAWLPFLPYSECEQCAFEQASRILVVDPDGVVYYNYNMEMYEGFFKLKYMSNLDTDDWDTEDGMRTLYDFLRRNRDDNNSAYLAGWDEVWNILSSLRDAMEKKHVRISSLAYKVSKVFGSLLENEDIVKKLAESREVNEKMIDMIKVFNDHEETKKADVIPMTMFAKK